MNKHESNKSNIREENSYDEITDVIDEKCFAKKFKELTTDENKTRLLKLW